MLRPSTIKRSEVVVVLFAQHASVFSHPLRDDVKQAQALFLNVLTQSFYGTWRLDCIDPLDQCGVSSCSCFQTERPCRLWRRRYKSYFRQRLSRSFYTAESSEHRESRKSTPTLVMCSCDPYSRLVDGSGIVPSDVAWIRFESVSKYNPVLECNEFIGCHIVVDRDWPASIVHPFRGGLDRSRLCFYPGVPDLVFSSLPLYPSRNSFLHVVPVHLFFYGWRRRVCDRASHCSCPDRFQAFESCLLGLRKVPSTLLHAVTFDSLHLREVSLFLSS